VTSSSMMIKSASRSEVNRTSGPRGAQLSPQNEQVTVLSVRIVQHWATYTPHNRRKRLCQGPALVACPRAQCGH
jgi:hypothetical protein